MPKKSLCLVAVAALSCVCLAEAPSAQEGPKGRIEKATAIFFGPPDPSVTKEKIVGAILDLLDLAAEITPDGEYKEQIAYRIGVAKDLIKDDSIFNDKARQYLSFAYRMMTDGKKFEPPKELDEFVTPEELQEKTLKYMKGLVDGAIGALDSGDRQKGARLIVELVLMTVTPVKG